jgi:hypothetical protein
MSRVIYNNTTSKTHHILNGVPQLAVLSPLLFNIFTHDIPQGAVKIATCADDFTAISQHHKINIATMNL